MTAATLSDVHAGRARAAAEDQAVQLAGEISSILVEVISRDEALINRLATALVDGLRSRLGGGDVYIPAPDKSARNTAIRAEFNGRNMSEVCRRHGVKPSTVYRIVGANPVTVARTVDPGK
jgi:Mor family transcriptional regulator